MSFLVTRPASPVPGTALISTLCSAAILRTTGVDFRRSRSSIVSDAPLPPVASPTDRDSGADSDGAIAGLDRGGGAELSTGAVLRGGLDGAGASGAAGAADGAVGCAGTGAAGGGAAGAFGL